MSHLYILKSLKYSRNYTGVTENIEERLQKHNKGDVKSTKHWCPWFIVYTEEYPTLAEAKKREWFLKCTPQGGKEKKEILKKAGIPAQRA
ncbi:MAG: putative endonuclease containing a URI domain [Parcubacteria group bacterium Gr01-1014_29]|nr:MAG: putative endonuclease containing a URI domain [Parcubacteria group bacterium Gr01-1014_29]